MGTNSEAHMMEDVQISNQKISRAIGRLQKIRRIHMFRRAVQIVWRDAYASITIQRVVRGLFGRLYAALFKKLYPIAGKRILTCWLQYKSRQIRKIWKTLIRRLTR